MSTWQQQLADCYPDRIKGGVVAPVEPKPAPIIRQSSKLPNKTEERFRLTFLEVWRVTGKIDRYCEHESIRLDIGDGVTLKPDWPYFVQGKLCFVEVKGAFIREDASIKLKCAARQYPEFAFWLYQWKGGIWIPQPIKP